VRENGLATVEQSRIHQGRKRRGCGSAKGRHREDHFVRVRKHPGAGEGPRGSHEAGGG